jgi:hypothetical protein
MLQKLAEQQAKAKRRAKAVELVMQGLQIQLEDLKSRKRRKYADIFQGMRLANWNSVYKISY